MKTSAKSLASQIASSAISVIALATLSRASDAKVVGSLVIILVLQAIAVTASKSATLSAYVIHSGNLQTVGAGEIRTLIRVTAVGSCAFFVVAGFVSMTVDLGAGFLMAVVAWQASVVAMDTLRSFAAIYASVTFALAIQGAQIFGFLGLLLWARHTNASPTVCVLLFAILNTSCVGAQLGLLRQRVVRSGSAGTPKSLRYSLARERAVLAAGLGIVPAVMSVSSPVVAAGWQVANQVVASPTGYLASAISIAATGRLRQTSLRGESLRKMSSAWFAGVAGIMLMGFILVVFPPGSRVLRSAFGAEVWESATTLLLGCCLYILGFIYLDIAATIVRVTGAVRRPGGLVATLGLAFNVAVAGVVIWEPDYISFVAALMPPTALAMLGLAQRAKRKRDESA
jgi:hypothetical protein